LNYLFLLFCALNEQIKEKRAFFYRFSIQEKDLLALNKKNKEPKNTLKYLEPNQTKPKF